MDVTTEEVQVLIEHYEEQLKDYDDYSGENAEYILEGFRTRLLFWKKQSN